MKELVFKFHNAPSDTMIADKFEDQGESVRVWPTGAAQSSVFDWVDIASVTIRPL